MSQNGVRHISPAEPIDTDLEEARSKVRSVAPAACEELLADPAPGHWTRPEWERLRQRIERQSEELRRLNAVSSPSR